LVVILDYNQTAGPLQSEVLSSRQRSGPVPRPGKVWERHVSQEKQALKRKQPGLRTSQGIRTPAGSRTPHRVLDSNRTPLQGKVWTPRLRVVRGRHVYEALGLHIEALGLHIEVHLPSHSLR